MFYFFIFIIANNVTYVILILFTCYYYFKKWRPFIFEFPVTHNNRPQALNLMFCT